MTRLYEPFGFAPYLEIDGILISNNATTPNTEIDVTAGMCRDSTNTFDLNLGNYEGAIDSQDADVTTTIDATVNGLNGLDTGSLAASSMYYIYVIANPLGSDPVGLILSLTGPATGPRMPSNYCRYRLVGAIPTDGSSHFVLFDWSGTKNYRTCKYRTPIATSITAGNATSYTNINLVTQVPKIDNLPVYIDSAFTPGAASRTLSLAPPASTGYERLITGQVSSVPVTNTDPITSRLATISAAIVPSVAYKVANSGDAAAINVAGFDLFV